MEAGNKNTDPAVDWQINIITKAECVEYSKDTLEISV